MPKMFVVAHNSKSDLPLVTKNILTRVFFIKGSFLMSQPNNSRKKRATRPRTFNMRVIYGLSNFERQLRLILKVGHETWPRKKNELLMLSDYTSSSNQCNAVSI